MSQSSNSKTQILSLLFWIVLGLTLVVWLLRGLRILTSISGWAIWVLLLLSISLGVINRLQTPRRY